MSQGETNVEMDVTLRITFKAFNVKKTKHIMQ